MWDDRHLTYAQPTEDQNPHTFTSSFSSRLQKYDGRYNSEHLGRHLAEELLPNPPPSAAYAVHRLVRYESYIRRNFMHDVVRSATCFCHGARSHAALPTPLAHRMEAMFCSARGGNWCFVNIAHFFCPESASILQRPEGPGLYEKTLCLRRAV